MSARIFASTKPRPNLAPMASAAISVASAGREASRASISFLSGVPAARPGHRTFWLLLQRTQVDLFIKDPGFDVDLYVGADLVSMAKVWLGDISFEMARRSGTVQFTGPRELKRAFPSWLMLSHFAAVPRVQNVPPSGQSTRAEQ